MTVTYADIQAAAQQLDGQVKRTPAIHAPALDAATGAEVHLKLENFQVTGSFKARGAYVKLAALSEDERGRGVIAASAGNHAQGLAYHAGRMGISATIYMPEGTPYRKVGRTEGFGAKVILTGATFDAAREAALAAAEEENRVYVPAFDDPHIIAGQGTAALEFLEQVPDIDTMVLPVGGGGLIAGSAIAAKAMNPDIRIVAVQTRQFPSLNPAAAEPASGITIADGIAVNRVGELNKVVIDDLVDDMVFVEEDQVEDGVRRLVEDQSIVAEGAGGAAVAGLLAMDAASLKDRRVGLIISGGNIDSRLLASVLMRGLVRDGRLARLRIAIYDQPGMLAKVAKLVGEEGGNIVEVTHQRMFFDVPIRRTDLDLVVETIDADHVNRLIDALKAAGFEARELSNRSA